MASPIRIRHAFPRETRASLDIGAHVHHTIQMLHCVSGGMTSSVDGTLFGLGPGDTLLIPPGAQRALWRSGRPPTYLVILFDDLGLGSERIHRRLMGLPEELVADRQALHRELTALGGPDSNFMVEALVVRMLITLMREAERHGDEPERRRYTDRRDEAALQGLVRRVEAVMQRNLANPLNRDDVASMVDLSAPHLARLFKRATGTTLHRRLTELRMAQAQLLLRDSTQSVSQIAGEVGYGSFSHFTKAFRAVTGKTPSAWREEGPGSEGR